MEDTRMNLKAFYALSFTMMLTFMGLTVVSPLMAIYAKSMGASGMLLGIFYGAFPVSRTLLMPFVGRFSDRRGRKPVMITGLIFYGAITILYALAQNMLQLIAIRFAHGFASALLTPIAAAYIGDICPKGKEATYMGRFNMFQFIGSSLGPMLGGVLATWWSINSVFYVMTGFVVFVFLLVVFLVPNMKPQLKQEKTEAPPVLTILKDNKVKAISMYMASRAIFRNSIGAFLPLLAVETLGMSIATAGFIVSMYRLAGALGQGILSPVADKFDRKKILILISLIGPLPVFFLHEMHSALGLLAILVPVALLNSMSRASAGAYSVEAGKKYSGMGVVQGIIFSAQSTATFIGPQISGFTMDRFGITYIYLPVAALGMIAAFFVTYWLLKKEPSTENILQPTGHD
ncbi:MAG: MFS transporter [Chloroflexota bacterium]